MLPMPMPDPDDDDEEDGDGDVAVDDDAAVPRLFLWLFSLAERNKDQKMPARQQQWPTTIIIANGNNKLSLRQKRNTKYENVWEKRTRVVFSRRQEQQQQQKQQQRSNEIGKQNQTHTHTHEERLSQKAAQSQSFGC